MIHVICHRQSEPGTRARVPRDFESAVVRRRSAPKPAASSTARRRRRQRLPPQGPLRPDVVVILEKWESLPALMRTCSSRT